MPRSAIATFLLYIGEYSTTVLALPNVNNVIRSLRGLDDENGLSREELRCSMDSQSMYSDHPALEQVLSTLKDNIDIQVNEAASSMELSFNQDYIVELETACNDASGLFVYLNETDFVCQYMGRELDVDVGNFVQCLADTPECVGLDQIKYLEEVWDAMDLECRIAGQPTSPHTPKPYHSSNAGNSSGSTSTTNGPSKSFMAGVLIGKISFLVICASAIALFIYRSERQRPPSYASYEMSIQDDSNLT
jgi:hypothetical protein